MAYEQPATLSSTLGSPSSQGGGGGGFSVFGWHPSLPNLGGFTAAKQLVSGFIGLPEMGANLVTDAATNNWGQFNPWSQDTHVGKLATGMGQGFENLATSAASPLGIPFTRYNVGDEVVSPLLQKANEGIFPTGHDQSGHELPMFKPTSLYTRPGGPITGLVQDVSTAAVVAGPVAGVLGKAAGAAEVTAATAASDAAEAARVAEATGTAESAATSAEKASIAEQAGARSAQLQRYAHMAHNVAHPYQYLGGRASDIVLGARDRVFPNEYTVPETPPTGSEVLAQKAAGVAVDSTQLNNAIVSSIADPHMLPERAAASNVEGAPVHQAAATAPTAPSALQAAGDDLAASLAGKAPELTPAPAPGPLGKEPITVYRGQPVNPNEPVSPNFWTETRSEAASHAAASGGEVLSTQVPKDVWDEAHRAAVAEGHHGTHDTVGHLPPEWADTAARAAEEPLTPGAKAAATRAAAKAAEEAQPGSKIADEQQANIEAAQETVRKSEVARQLAIKLATPPPPWAQRLVEHLPTPVNRMIASFATPITHLRFNNLARDYARIVEVSQHEAQTSPAVVAMQDAAAQVVAAVPGSDRFDLSHIVGEEVAKQATGSNLVAALIHDGHGDPEIVDALKRAAANEYQGMPKELWDKMSPEARVAFTDQVNAAAAAMQGLAEKHRQTLLASRPGMQGIERAVLGDTSIPMSTTELKLYRQAMKEERRSRILMSRVDDAEARRVGEMAQQRLIGEKMSAESQRLIDQGGVLERAVQDLHDPLPLGLRAERIANTAANILRESLYGGTVWDVGRDVSNLPPDGVFVNIAHQGDIVVDAAHIEDAQAQLEHMLAHPVRPDGSEYGPMVYAGSDARLHVTPHTDPVTGQVTLSVDMGMGTWGGRALPQWLATGLGEMYGAPEAINAATGEVIHMTGQEAVRNLWSHYMGQALDPQSAFSKFGESLRKSAEEEGMAPADVDASLRYYMTLDYSMARAVPDHWDLGDYFRKSTVDTGKSTPTGPFRAQTVLDLTTKEGIDQAMKNHDVSALNSYLSWYYDSHDYIEAGYRNHDVTLLNGETRNAAETFYDLLAVTSVMANPKTNLGRSLMAFSNLNDFMGKNHDAFLAAQEVMDQMERIPASERATLEGTELSARFVNTPAVRALTEGTQMVNDAKYKVFDILHGRLKLDTATNADIANVGAHWTGDIKNLSEDMISRKHVLDMLDTMRITGPGADRYRAWAQQLDEVEANVAEMSGRTHAPITDAQDVERKLSQDTGVWANMGDAREVSPGEYQELADAGEENVDKRIRNGSPNSLAATPQMAHDAYLATRNQWQGATIDAHTGEWVADPGHTGESTETPNLYSVTARTGNMQTVTLPATADEAEFAAAYKEALKRFKPILDSDGGHLGIFYGGNVKDGVPIIEFDPSYVVSTPQEVEEIGAYTHADGGAYHFRSGNGYFVPHVRDEYATPESATAHYNSLFDQGKDIAKSDPEVERARQQALLEYHGSNALAKLRNFRSNLSDPHGSIGVTLDSVMARMYGFSENRWAGGDRMGIKSREVRDEAGLWSKLAKREVMPHELQALMWINTKLEIGRMDWGRLQAHLDMGQEALDHIISEAQAGRDVKQLIKDFNPFHDYYSEDLDYSIAAKADRHMLKDLNARYKADPASLTAKELDQRDELKSRNLQDAVKTSQARYTAPRPKAQIGKPPEGTTYETIDRKHIPYNATQTTSKLAAWDTYEKKTAAQWRRVLKAGDYEKVRKEMISWAQRKRRHVEGDAGGAFDQVGEDALADHKTNAWKARENLVNGTGGVPVPDQWGAYNKRGDITELSQRTRGKLRGATILTPDKTNRLTMRLFEGAGLDTLIHEGAHLIRQFLPEDMVQRLARHPGYQHLLDATETAEKVAAEEKFVADLHYFIRRAVRTGAHDGVLSDVFEKVAATLEEQHAAAMDTAYGRTFNSDVGDFWNNLFHPEINPATPAEDPLAQRMPTPGTGTEVKRFRWESDADLARRARQYGEARGRLQANVQKQALAARAASRADAAARKMFAAIVSTPTEIEEQATKLHTHSQAILEKLGRSMEDPTRAQVPREWQPMWDAFEELRRQVAETPALAEYLDEIPATWSEVLKHAADHGFEPTYLPDMTWEQAQRQLFGHIQLGKRDPGTETISNTRKQNNAVLRKNMLGDRSIEALAAGSIEATRELYSNELVTFIEKNWMRPFESGATPPDGWVPWDAEKQFVLTGTRADRKVIAVGANGIVPVEVAKAIKGMTSRYDHWSFHTLSKITKPWVTYNLTLSPKWYLHVAISNVIRATLEGVSVREWATAVKQWKHDDLPTEVYDHSINQLMRDGEHTLLPTTIREAKQTEGMKAALHQVRTRVSKIHDVLDEVSRAAVFEHTLAKTGSRSAALTRMYEALVDYGHLSPLERAVTRSAIPFYPFYKGMLKLIARFPADHPYVTYAMLQLGKMHEEYLQDQFGGKVPDAYLGYANIGGLHNFTILDPFINPIHLADIHQINSTFNPYVDIMLRDAYDAAEPGSGEKGMSPTGQPVTQVNPLAAAGQDLAQAPVSRLIGDVFTGGDVYRKNPGVLGGVGTYLGEPATPNAEKIRQAVASASGQGHVDANGGSLDSATINQLVQQALAKAPQAAPRPPTEQQKLVRSLVRARRPAKAKVYKVKAPRKPRRPSIKRYGQTHHG